MDVSGYGGGVVLAIQGIREAEAEKDTGGAPSIGVRGTWGTMMREGEPPGEAEGRGEHRAWSEDGAGYDEHGGGMSDCCGGELADEDMTHSLGSPPPEWGKRGPNRDSNPGSLAVGLRRPKQVSYL